MYKVWLGDGGAGSPNKKACILGFPGLNAGVPLPSSLYPLASQHKQRNCRVRGLLHCPSASASAPPDRQSDRPSARASEAFGFDYFRTISIFIFVANISKSINSHNFLICISDLFLSNISKHVFKSFPSISQYFPLFPSISRLFLSFSINSH